MLHDSTGEPVASSENSEGFTEPVGTHLAKCQVDWQGVEAFLSDERVQLICSAALQFGARPGLSMGIVFVDDANLASMHGEWLDDDEPTDVITFDLSDPDEPGVSNEGGQDGVSEGPQAELYISSERAQLIAVERGVSPERELALYLVHGCLHLCGYDDHDAEERQRMRKAEAQVLQALNYEADPENNW